MCDDSNAAYGCHDVAEVVKFRNKCKRLIGRKPELGPLKDIAYFVTNGQGRETPDCTLTGVLQETGRWAAKEDPADNDIGIKNDTQRAH